MSEIMNEPVEYTWSDEEIIKEYERIRNKRKVAKIFGITVPKLSMILKKKPKEMQDSKYE